MRRAGFGGIALADMLQAANLGGGSLTGAGHPAPKAKRVIFLFQSGAPSQIDLFDHKPQLIKDHGKQLPDSIRKGQRLSIQPVSMAHYRQILKMAGI